VSSVKALSVEEYRILFPDEGSILGCHGPAYLGCIVLKEGMILFTEETAHRLAGCYHGGYGSFSIQDFTDATSPYGKDKGRKILELWHEGDLARERKFNAGFSKYKYSHRIEYPSIALPVQFKIYGNDDTSYSKFYATREAALTEFELFEANQPLDLNEMINGFGFVFTN
jgi:hypothetical protein